MSEIVVARTPVQKAAAIAFMHRMGVRMHASSDFQAFCVTRDEQIIGAVGYNNFNGRVCYSYAAADGPHWITRELLIATADYPFRQLDLVSVFAHVAETNYRCLAIMKRVGFEEVHRVREGWEPGVDLIILEVRRSTYRQFARRPEYTTQMVLL